jgi:hypothetical protein
MLAIRRAISIPLFVVGGALLLVGYGGGLAAGLYYTYVSWKLIIHGNIVEGIIVGSIVLMVVVTLFNVLNIPGAAFVMGASRLWSNGQASDPGTPQPDPHDGYWDDGEPHVSDFGADHARELEAPQDRHFAHERDPDA